MTKELRDASTISELLGMLYYELEAIDQTEKKEDRTEYMIEALNTMRAISHWIRHTVPPELHMITLEQAKKIKR